MLSNNKLLIDQNCPLCKVYGTCFTKMGLIDSKTVSYYQTVDAEIFHQIDADRAKSEVALIDSKTGKTVYGIDAFIKILAGNRRFLIRFFNQPIIHFFLTKLYRFISYNRHVIAGSHSPSNGRNCVPAVHLGYRWLYVILAALFTGFMVNHFAVLLDQELGLQSVFWREYAICFGQIVWQFGWLSIVDSSKRLDYLGNMSTVSVMGGLLLLPLFALNAVVDLSAIALFAGFGIIVGWMFLQHLKRCKKLGLPLSASISWVLFRTLVLVLIFIYSVTL